MSVQDGVLVSIAAADIEMGPYLLVSYVQNISSEEECSKQYQCVSVIVSVYAFDSSRNSLSTNVKIVYPYTESVLMTKTIADTYENSSVDFLCHFKDDNDSINATDWSTKGCVTIINGELLTDGFVCACSHLTSFSILMVPAKVLQKKTVDDEKVALSILTYIGLSTSIVFLTITLVIICSFEELRNLERFKILRHLVTSLLFAYISFLLIEINTGSKVICTILAGYLHYTILTSFTWMLIFSTDIYLKIKHPFLNHYKRYRISRYVGWISPGVFVTISIIIRRDNYIAPGICWINPESEAMFTLIAFIFIIVSIVLVELIIIGYEAFMKSQSPNKTQQELSNGNQIRSLFFRLLLLAPVVGIPWMFGILLSLYFSDVIEYIFVIFNSTQGFLIWLSQCFFSSEVRSTLRRHYRRSVNAE
ncbi:adhesion G protein-coupled receptor E3-like [Antedon mediterranea]|uniref:adhesion G protein-coupled receptor E3-like n=1 Tax=Antedon mediterranea TaxID=105859 RepID=UPI003AF7A526